MWQLVCHRFDVTHRGQPGLTGVLEVDVAGFRGSPWLVWGHVSFSQAEGRQFETGRPLNPAKPIRPMQPTGRIFSFLPTRSF